VQLVFKGARESQLTLSRNMRLVRSLKVGEAYQLIGPEYQLGDKTYIHEPKAIPVESIEMAPRHSKKRWILASAAAFVVMLTGTVFAARHFAASSKAQAQAGAPTQQTGVQGSSTTELTTTDTSAAQDAAVTPDIPQDLHGTAPQTTTGAPATHTTTTTNAAPQNTTPTPAPTPTPTPPPPSDPAPADPPADTAPADKPSDQNTTPADTPPPANNP
jgi:hypothetical protein